MSKHICCFTIFPERLGYFPSSPGLSCKQILDSGDSGGDGEYWIDPENSGNPLRVYCDMTTDGGDYHHYEEKQSRDISENVSTSLQIQPIVPIVSPLHNGLNKLF